MLCMFPGCCFSKRIYEAQSDVHGTPMTLELIYICI